MDMQMPELDGMAATAALRAANLHMPVIALTAHGTEEARQQSLRAGCCEHLVKPVNHATLMNAIAARTSVAGLNQRLTSDLSGDPRLTDLIDTYVAELPEQVSALCEFSKTNHDQALRRLLHQIKGAGGGYGLAPLSAAAAEAMAAFDETDVNHLAKCVDDLVRLMRSVQGYDTGRNGFMLQRVLIIDDSPQIHRLVEAWLKSDVIELATAPTATAGHSMAVTWQPDLILLDVDLPDQNGFELCRQLKSDEACCKIPIVFLTGASSPEDRVAGLNLGAVDYVVKPFHPAEFQARVRAALRTKYLLDLLQQRAQIDGLTGLRNRSFLDERLATERAMLRRHARPLSCIMIDVDHFKAVNDLYGHATGDEALRAVAEVLIQATRLEDVVARYGGEEFTILTPGTDGDGAVILAERIRAGIEKLTVNRGATVLRVTCSLGVAGYDPANPTALIPNADTALYAAKANGRNRVELFAPTMLHRTDTAAA